MEDGRLTQILFEKELKEARRILQTHGLSDHKEISAILQRIKQKLEAGEQLERVVFDEILKR